MNITAIYLTGIMLLASSFTACDGRTEEPFTLPFDNGKILYVEGLQGEGWLTANPFGELVMIDGKTQTRHVLTWDGYYYAHPNLTPDGKYLVFESKRARNIGAVGLSARSDIYKLDIESREVTKFHDEITGQTGEQFWSWAGYPSLSPSGNKLALVRHVLDQQREFISVYNLINDGLTDLYMTNDYKKEIYNPSPTNSITPEWSEDESKIILTIRDRFDTFVMIMDLLNGDTHIITNDMIERRTGNTPVIYCRSANWVTNDVFYYSCTKVGLDYTAIYRYELQTGVSSKITSVAKDSSGLNIRDIKVSKNENHALVIGAVGEEEYTNIYKIDLLGDGITQITYSETMKRWLRWYED